MIGHGGPRREGHNIRFVHSECQVLMMRPENDLIDLIQNCIDEKFNHDELTWSKNPCVTIVAASKGYPEKFEKLKEIKNLPRNEKNHEQIFHAGTIKKDEKIFSNGGRVLNSTVSMKDLRTARDRALDLLDKIEWENKYYRRDIGWRAIK